MNETKQNSDPESDRKGEATDSRTLDEIEETENVSSESVRSTVPSPDKGSRGVPIDDARNQK